MMTSRARVMANQVIKVRKARRSYLKIPHPVQVHHKVQTQYLEQVSAQEILEQVGQLSSAQHVVNIHTGGRTAHMIIFVQHVIITIMLPICVGPHDRVLQYAFTVAALTTGQVIAPEIHGTTGNNHVKLQIP